jgi:predicted dienelactone hydrolase
MRTALLPAAACLLLGCPADGPDPVEYPDTLAWALDEAGPFQAAHFRFLTDYVMPTTGETRQIWVSVWYPTEDTEGDPPDHYGGFAGEAFERATAAEPVHEGGYPVLAYSHGHVMYPAASKFLGQHFATHGWITVAPAHEGNTLTTAGEDDPRPVHLWIDRSFDVSAALDAVADGRFELAGPANMDRVVMSGHSFGGHTTWATAGGSFDVDAIEANCDNDRFIPGTCGQQVLDAFADGALDDRVLGAIALDGSGGEDWFGPTGLGDIAVPMMQQYTDSDPGRIVPPERAPGVDIVDVEIEGACHGTFSVATGCGLDPDEGYAIVSAYAFAFARQVALGDDSARTAAVLDGSELLSERVTIR